MLAAARSPCAYDTLGLEHIPSFVAVNRTCAEFRRELKDESELLFRRAGAAALTSEMLEEACNSIQINPRLALSVCRLHTASDATMASVGTWLHSAMRSVLCLLNITMYYFVFFCVATGLLGYACICTVEWCSHTLASGRVLPVACSIV